MKIYIGKRLIADQVFMADNLFTRLKGLLGKTCMEQGQAMVIKPCNSIHTCFMRFNIDVLFIGKNNEVVKVVRNMAPFRFAAAIKAKYVIELPANFGIKPGELVEVLRSD
ncbi:hypothetical protein SAMN05660649_04818 [Desulfotomaculum arcticum]|uniref:DUF192 domain-containing protein n=1 Tax=Desulfotruncus arcticus DSM 17038 TaxID=1121424 RepID=A0A1I2Z8L8_9FIRM|nr:DUF192 domain-containing protein [Desulfotruncus arcticus]SFH34187.1 hypothetical protein SAMN05660649_04818 [Desulfotomaculum arcticum] [Desulfotruncus arcticus DSM 17038]